MPPESFGCQRKACTVKASKSLLTQPGLATISVVGSRQELLPDREPA
jgi:hypothetical protein